MKEQDYINATEYTRLATVTSILREIANLPPALMADIQAASDILIGVRDRISTALTSEETMEADGVIVESVEGVRFQSLEMPCDLYWEDPPEWMTPGTKARVTTTISPIGES